MILFSVVFQSEEDRQLKEELEALVTSLHEQPYNAETNKAQLHQIATLIKSATTSMTSVPKPLKFMIPHYSLMQVMTIQNSMNFVSWKNWRPQKIKLPLIFNYFEFIEANYDETLCK